MSTTVTISQGSTLWGYAKQILGSGASNTAIANMVNKIAKANQITNPNSIFAGRQLVLPDAPKPVKSDNSEKNQNSTDVTTTVEDSSATIAPKEENVGEKFDNWTQNVSVKTQQAWDDAEAKASAFASQHSSPEDAQSREDFNNKAIQEANDKISQIQDFSFVGDDFAKDIKENGGKNASNIYMTGIMKLSKDSIKNVKDLDGDATTVNYEEFKQKELDDYKKANPNTGLDENMLGQIDKTSKLAFDVIDQDHNGKIDEKEEAAVYAAMDQNAKGNMDGKISQNGYTGVSAALGDEKYTDAMKTKLQTVYGFLFGQQ